MWKIIKRKINNVTDDVGFFLPLFMITMVIFLIAVIFFAPCEEDNTDPRKGVVWIQHSSVTKVCDGSTLVYNGDGTQLVPNSPEC